MLDVIFTGLILAGLIPLWCALWALRRTSLAHALVWTIAAWLTWGIALIWGNPFVPGMDPARYCALCLTGCAGVAVLGARRPHVGAWNLVVAGLFSVMVLPLVESLTLGTHPVDALRIVFLSATIAVGILNYLPTRFAPLAVLLLPACAGEIALLHAPDWFPAQGEALALHGLILAAPWIGWLCMWERGTVERSTTDRIWLAFRDRWGLFWAQRVREQFNQATQSAGLPVTLTWRGLIRHGVKQLTREEEDKILQTLCSVVQRFMLRDPSES